MSIIRVRNLTFGYTDIVILKDLNFEVEQGSFWAIAGPNGVGKTTLLNLLCGQLHPRKATITIRGLPVSSYSIERLARTVAIVRQEFVPVFDFSVLETVMMARTPYFGTLGFEGKTDIEIVNESLGATKTADLASRPLRQISSGERQRVFIARALAQNTPILLLDEPTSFLDLKHQVGIYDLLKKAQLEKGKTIVAITHDINLAVQYCDRILLLASDLTYYTGLPEELFSEKTIEKVFGVTGFAGRVGREKFFLPLGRLAKDSGSPGSV